MGAVAVNVGPQEGVERGPGLNILVGPLELGEFGVTAFWNGECARRESTGSRTVRAKWAI